MIRFLKYELSDTEKFCIRGYLSDQTTDNLLLAYSLSRDKPCTFSNKQSAYNTANRWLNSEPIKEYIEDHLHYERMRVGCRFVYVYINGDIPDDDLNVTDNDLHHTSIEKIETNKLKITEQE